MRRENHAATLLPNGKVLIVGGRTVNEVPVASAEIFDPATGMFQPTASMNEVRSFPLLVPLSIGVLVTGGGGVNDAPLATAELYVNTTWTQSRVFVPGMCGRRPSFSFSPLTVQGRIVGFCTPTTGTPYPVSFNQSFAPVPQGATDTFCHAGEPCRQLRTRRWFLCKPRFAGCRGGR